jgi:predicted O-methyltransferase YrrM
MSDFKFTGSFAEVYDRHLVPMDFAPHGRRLAERVAALAPRRVLETGAGTGVVTRELARILPSAVTITATDLNESCWLRELISAASAFAGSRPMPLTCLFPTANSMWSCVSSA